MYKLFKYCTFLFWFISVFSPQLFAVDAFSETDSFINVGQNRGGYVTNSVVKLIDKQRVSRSQLNMLQSPIAVADNFLYTVNIEPASDRDDKQALLYTVLRQGSQRESGEWDWKSVVIDDRTVYDPWHTAPSIGVDSDGFIHVVYNMHNTPWQYKVSKYPHDISDFNFRGQIISDEEVDSWKFSNVTSFPDLGTAAIPGNQITYPSFSHDLEGKLYISYRFASKPKRKFSERAMSAGIAIYDTYTKTWSAIGGKIPVDEGDRDYLSNAPEEPEPFAIQQRWTVSAPQLAFGPSNEIYSSIMWRAGTAGALYTRPCVIQSKGHSEYINDDYSVHGLPLTKASCGNMGFDNYQGFYSLNKIDVNSQRNVSVLLHKQNNERILLQRRSNSESWSLQDSPPGATDIFYDRSDNLWAVGTGLSIYRKSYNSDGWTTILEESNDNRDCYPKVIMSESKDRAYIHTHSCDEKSFSVYVLQVD